LPILAGQGSFKVSQQLDRRHISLWLDCALQHQYLAWRFIMDLQGSPPFANTPVPPYYVVSFSSTRKSDPHVADDGYSSMAFNMERMALEQPGCLGVESARDLQGFGITNSFWKTAESILAWKAVVEHQVAQRTGKQKWYERYLVRVAKVERAYGFDSAQSNGIVHGKSML
jgi:heme-degrading monooxygenase HmoA